MACEVKQTKVRASIQQYENMEQHWALQGVADHSKFLL